MAETRAVHLRVGGRVQGVGFRYFVQQEASLHGVKGYVRNLSDGDVEAVAEGPRDAIERFVEAIRRGPRSSIVDRLERRDGEATGAFERFEIRF